MINPEIEVRTVSTESEDKLFLGLAEQLIDTNKMGDLYKLLGIVQGTQDGAQGSAYSVYCIDRSAVAVELLLDGKPIDLGDGESVRYMTFEEINLLRALGRLSVDGTEYLIQSITANINSGCCDRRHFISMNLYRQSKE